MLLLALLAPIAALAQTGSGPSAALGPGYDLAWFTVDGGGGLSGDGGYTLHGTAGQPDAGALAGSGGYTLSGGFWVGERIPAPGYLILLPLVMRNQ